MKANHQAVPAEWATWFERSFLLQLDRNAAELADMGVTRQVVETRILATSAAPHVPQPLARDQATRLRRQFQRTAQAMLPSRSDPAMEVRFRHKLERWRVHEWPRIRASHCLAFLRALKGKVPPMTWAASWKALWNGWPTSRRTQGRHGHSCCIFERSETAEDSVEHYSSCVQVQAIAGELLGLPRGKDPQERLADFLGIGWSTSRGKAVAIKIATRMSAVYRVHCHCSHGRISPGAACREALGQACREVIRGSRQATAVYDAAIGWQ